MLMSLARVLFRCGYPGMRLQYIERIVATEIRMRFS